MRLTAPRPASSVPGVALAAALMLLGGLLVANTFVPPLTPMLLTDDQVFFWTDAQRMLFGERPYVDFFQFTAPGTDLVYFLALKLAGGGVVATNLVDVALGLALSSVCFRVAAAMMSTNSAWLATALFAAAIYLPVLNGTHHLFSVLCVMAAVAVAGRGDRLRRTALAGALLGAASFLTLMHGAVALLAWSGGCARSDGLRLRGVVLRVALAAGAYLVSLCALNGYFLITVGWRVLWSSEVTYVRRFMIGETPFLPVLNGSVTWERAPVLAPILFACFALPLVYPASLAACWIAARCRRLTEERVVVLVALTGSALFLEVSLSPSWLREYAVAMPGVVLLAWWVDRLDVGTPLRRGCMTFGWLAAVSSGVAQTAARQQTGNTSSRICRRARPLCRSRRARRSGW